MGKMNLANKITISRILLIPFFVAAIIYSVPKIALLIFSLAVFSDALDGYIARMYNQRTELGTFLDPMADKLLVVTAFICLAVNSLPSGVKLPPWVVLVVVSRDAIIVLGSAIIHIVKGELRVAPSRLGKLTTFLQMATIISVLLGFPSSFIVWNIAVLFTILSGIHYIRIGSRLLNAE